MTAWRATSAAAALICASARPFISPQCFAVETFIDELAHAAKSDPFEFRRALLTNHPRHRRTLELAAEKSGWGQPLPPGVGRGIAVHESFGAFVAQMAYVSVDSSGQVRVKRVVCAIDCGPVVNPDGIRAQMESRIAFGLTAALYGEITFENGRVQQSNFHDYPLPIAPAVANAIFALTGHRIRRLPAERCFQRQNDSLIQREHRQPGGVRESTGCSGIREQTVRAT